MKKIVLGLLIIFSLCNHSFAFEFPETIRIGLSYGSNAVDKFTVYAPSGVVISDIGKMRGEVTIEKSSSNKPM